MVNSSTFHIVNDFKPKSNFTFTDECINSNPNNNNAYGNHTHSQNSHLLYTCNSNSIKIFHQNIGGITHKIDELLISLSNINPQLLCLIEYHLRPDKINNVHLDQYTLGAHFCRYKFKQGGTAIFVNNDILFYDFDLTLHIKEKDLEICALKLHISSTCLPVMCVYRSPSGNFYFLKQLALVLNKLYKISTNIVLGGDFNINFLEKSSKVLLLESVISCIF